ncbi:MAG: UDP-N-acetylglucosamine 2-epimerase (non-hydrolyzing), partial [bacterium]
TSKVLLGMRDLLISIKPDLLFVHGDTSTSTAAALASFYQKIPIAHIEAGLRTRNKYSPWPEEMNRQITARLSNYHFSPTIISKNNLIAESIDEKTIYITGNTVIDALHIIIERIKAETNFKNEIIDKLCYIGLNRLKLLSWQDPHENRKMVLITGHRRENFGDGFLEICKAIKELAFKFKEIDFIYPMHLNPNVRNAINTVFGSYNVENNIIPNIYFIEPLDYLPFIYLMSISYIVLTDSGGIQEEAPSLGKPVLVMRNNTERPEAITAGTVILVGTNKNIIVSKVSELINNNLVYNRMSATINPYGDGSASKKIVSIIKTIIKNNEI